MKTQLNNTTKIDLDDTKVLNRTVFEIPYFSIKEKLWKQKKLQVKQKYARLIATQQFVCKGEIIENGQKGGYVAINHNRPQIKLGKNSWIMGSFMGTEKHPSFVDKHSKIGSNTLLGQNITLGKNVVVGNNTFIEGSSKIGHHSVLGDNVSTSTIITGPQVLVGDNTTIGEKDLKNITSIGQTNFLGVTPNHYKHYWWNLNCEPIHLGKHCLTPSEFFQKYIKEKYYHTLITRIGANVQIARGSFIMSGATIGDEAKLGYQVTVGVKKEVDNKSIVQDKSIIQ